MTLPHLTTGRLVELIAAVLIIGAGVFFYRRRDPANGSYGGQGAVILFVIAAIMAIHAVGALEYHPSAAEAEYFQDHSR